jgi:dTMP kinase
MLISFEGLDGCGKTTQIAILTERLRASGRSVIVVREPGGTPLSEDVRRLLLDQRLSIAPFAELLLFSAARAQLVVDVVRPALERGDVVICDRFFDSTTAYQGAGRRVAPFSWIDAFNRQVTGGVVPVRTYLLDIDPEIAYERRAGRAEDRMESSGKDFFERVRKGYLSIWRADPQRVVRLDAAHPAEEIHDIIWADLRTLEAEVSTSK